MAGDMVGGRVAERGTVGGRVVGDMVAGDTVGDMVAADMDTDRHNYHSLFLSLLNKFKIKFNIIKET